MSHALAHGSLSMADNLLCHFLTEKLIMVKKGLENVIRFVSLELDLAQLLAGLDQHFHDLGIGERRDADDDELLFMKRLAERVVDNARKLKNRVTCFIFPFVNHER